MTPVEESQMVMIFALFIGIAGRTYLYFLVEKRRAEQLGEAPLTFDTDFLITAILAGVGSGFVALLSYPVAIAQVPEGSSTVGAFIIVVGFAFGSNEFLNKVLSFIDFNRLLESPKIKALMATMAKKRTWDVEDEDQATTKEQEGGEDKKDPTRSFNSNG